MVNGCKLGALTTVIKKEKESGGPRKRAMRLKSKSVLRGGMECFERLNFVGECVLNVSH